MDYLAGNILFFPLLGRRLVLSDTLAMGGMRCRIAFLMVKSWLYLVKLLVDVQWNELTELQLYILQYLAIDN